MRLEEVDPEEDRLATLAAEPRERAVRGLGGGALRAPARQLVVIRFESTREPERAGQRIGRHEGRRAIAVLPERLRRDGMVGREIPRVLVNSVASGIQPGQHGGVRGEGLRSRGIGVAEPQASRREGVEGGRLRPFRLGPDRVRARSVEGDEKDRGPHGHFGSRAAFTRAGGQQEERERRDRKGPHNRGSSTNDRRDETRPMSSRADQRLP